MNLPAKLLSIENIRVHDPEISGKKIDILYTADGDEIGLKFNYTEESTILEEDARIIALAPLVNYSLFAGEISADFSLSQEDVAFFKEMMRINSREVYINKLLKRKEFFRKEAIPISPSKAEADHVPKLTIRKTAYKPQKVKERGSVGILSSGGKESLLTYGMMKEIGAEVYPIYINESGGHWRTAKIAYDYMKKNDKNTLKIWTTVDRFYKEMNRKVSALNENALKMWSDTYPIQLFIFPVYILSALPYIRYYGLSYVMKGDEFDDPRNMKEEFGMSHYYGIYDQTQKFDEKITDYFNKKGYGTTFFSGVRGISGYVEERILFARYPETAMLQRSCHSCHNENGDMIPCGKCSKCNGVMLFLTSNGINPELISYKKDDVSAFRKDFKGRIFRLDEDEKDHSIFMLTKGKEGKEHSHIEKIHQNRECCDQEKIPIKFREAILGIIGEYTKGRTELVNGEWS